MTTNTRVPGFYVAHHRWLDAEHGPGALHKVGHSGDLRRRLADDAYATCFAPGWRYVFTFETGSKEEAARLEAGVLLCAAAARVARPDGRPPSELVRLTGGAAAALARKVAAALGVAGAARLAPEYPRPPRAALSSTNPRPDPIALPDLSALYIVGPAAAPVANLSLTNSPLAAPPADGPPPAKPLPPKRMTAEDYIRAGREALAAKAAAEPAVAAEPAEAERRPPEQPEQPGGDDEDLDFVDVEFAAADPGPPRAPLEERAYQREAAAAALRELAAAGRGVLQMACRCGKTRVAHAVIQDYFARPPASGRARVLYLVPGLALLRQTALKLDHYGGAAAELLLVGSDGRPLGGLATLAPAAEAGSGGGGGGGGGAPAAAAAGTTDPAAVARACAAPGPRPLLVVATYQSSPLLPDAFDLTVFDECHRVCGAAAARPFTHVLLRHRGGDRLFMTATPCYEGEVSMKNRALFGGIAYAYHMREGIDAGHVNPFGLELVGRAAAPGLDDRDASAAQVLAAQARLGPGGKLLVFCRNIRHAEALCAAAAAAARAPGEGRFAGGLTCLAAHSRMGAGAAAAALARFCAPGAAAALFNCRLFQEGVEIPPLTGVFFAAPRHSPRDIIQSLCRPLSAAPGKPASRVFIPVAHAGPPGAGGDAAALARFASIVPYFDALVAEDPLLYEHLLDPAGVPYPLEWVESAAEGGGEAAASKAPLRYRPAELLAAARRAVRGAGRTERLLASARIPWAIGFGELRRIVVECGRYPKTTDRFVYGAAEVNFGRFYRYARDAYARWRAGAPQPLEPHQLRDLAALPGWEPYGLEGPYPWAEGFDFLDRWLSEHRGVPPMVEVHHGGYVGLDATPMERLSGMLTCINQADGRDRRGRPPGSGFTVDAAKRRELDALCAKHGLRWRKERRPPPPGAPPGAVGGLVENEAGDYAGAPTFIQEAYARFKAEWHGRGPGGSPYVDRWFPGYPAKHQHQERPDVWARRREVVPPRWRGREKAKKA